MGLFDTRSNRSVLSAGRSQEMPERLRRQLPARFDAIGEALLAGTEVREACEVVGRDLARDGVELSEALHGLRRTYQVLARREPDFAATEAISVAWSEETLAFIHQVSCENPLTGLATLAHLRTRVTEILRAAEDGLDATEHVVVVIDRTGVDPVAASLGLARVADRARLVFTGGETMAEVGPRRLLVLAPRHESLGNRVAALRELLGKHPQDADVRIWIEGLPAAFPAAIALLDELARS